MFGELVGGKGHLGEQEKDWMVRLEEDMTEFGISSTRGERLHGRLADGLDGSRKETEAFARNSHDADNSRAAVRLAKATAAPPTVGICTRRGKRRGEGWGVGVGGVGGGEWGEGCKILLDCD